MKELEDKARAHKDAMLRFISDAAHDERDIVVYFSTLDGSPIVSDTPGMSFAIQMVPATWVQIRGDSIRTPGYFGYVDLDYVFLIHDGADERLRVTCTDTPAQHSACAEFMNQMTVRALYGRTEEPLIELHPDHRESVPMRRRAGLRVLKGGRV